MKLQLNCRDINFGDNWVRISSGNYEGLYSYDVTKLPFGDETVSFIYAPYILPFYGEPEVKIILGEWFRVLKNGGVLRLSVPDFKVLCELYLNEGNDYKLSDLHDYICGSDQIEDSFFYCKSFYDRESLMKLLEEVGYQRVQEWDWRNTEHSRFEDESQLHLPPQDKDNGTLISLNIQAGKGGPQWL